MIDVSTHCHLDRPGKGFEDAFYLVVFIGSFGLDVEVHFCRIGQAFEEVQEHLRRHIPDSLPSKFGIPYQPGSASKVEGHLAQAVVHRQTVTVALYASLVAERL